MLVHTEALQYVMHYTIVCLFFVIGAAFFLCTSLVYAVADIFANDVVN